MARLVELQLHQCGYDFDVAHSGQEAIERARRATYDLILLDIMLPDLDGFEVISRLQGEGIDTRVLLQTGLLNRDEGASLGVSEYLVKPFNKAELIAGIEAVAGRSRPVRQFADGTEVIDDRTATLDRDDKRQHRRFPTERHARVVWPTVFDCRLVNMSHGGAALRLSDPRNELPDHFRLAAGFGAPLECRVCWRTGDKVGVKFL